uniref:Uncharacterized protein n=1 Tax=Physcomitrium patens TaxID=3218 RepID=A0A2K1JUK8_PHYPA|nr:hypothetical protein PHYPA_014979 [Physcomitrium patens]
MQVAPLVLVKVWGWTEGDLEKVEVQRPELQMYGSAGYDGRSICSH